jgi:hypothetical protein
VDRRDAEAREFGDRRAVGAIDVADNDAVHRNLPENAPRAQSSERLSRLITSS